MAYDASSIFCFFHCSTNCCCPSSLILGAQIECRLALSSTKNIFLLTPVPFLLLHNSVILLLLNYRFSLSHLNHHHNHHRHPTLRYLFCFPPPPPLQSKLEPSPHFCCFPSTAFTTTNSIVYPFTTATLAIYFFSFDYSPVEC